MVLPNIGTIPKVKKIFVCFVFIILSISLRCSYSEVLAQTGRITETLIVPYTAFNAQGIGEEQFKSDHKGDWFLVIKNSLIYNPTTPESDAVLKLKESQGYIELAMNGLKVSIVVNIKEPGHLNLFNSEDSWSSDKPMILLFSEADGGTITIINGERNLADRAAVGEFLVRTIEYYGVSHPRNMPIVSGGRITLEITSGHPVTNNSLVFLLIFSGFVIAILFSLYQMKSSKDQWSGRRRW